MQALQARLGHSFSKQQLLIQALTHRSFSADHNERLEFLGDAVLNLAIAGLLYERLGTRDEGDLSKVRASLVRQQSLYECATKLGLSKLLRLGAGEVRTGGKTRPSILADALEALFGAIYLDAGYPAAQGVIRQLFSQVRFDAQLVSVAKDAKTELQERMQKLKKPLPSYQVIGTEGAAHLQRFRVLCTIGDPVQTAQGQGTSRREAEQAAALGMLGLLGLRPDEPMLDGTPTKV